MRHLLYILLVGIVCSKQTQAQSHSRVLGGKFYEVSNHLGNVMTVVSDRKLAAPDATAASVEYAETDVLSFNDYYPYGMGMNGRSGSGDYRFGFQGQEMDDEVKGDGNAVNYRYRVHDVRLGRFFAVDPLSSKYSHYSSYQFSGNKVIQYIELEGLEEVDHRQERLNEGRDAMIKSQQYLNDKQNEISNYQNDNNQGVNPQGDYPILPPNSGQYTQKPATAVDAKSNDNPPYKIYYNPDGQQDGNKGSYVRVYPHQSPQTSQSEIDVVSSYLYNDNNLPNNTANLISGNTPAQQTTTNGSIISTSTITNITLVARTAAQANYLVLNVVPIIQGATGVNVDVVYDTTLPLILNNDGVLDNRNFDIERTQTTTTVNSNIQVAKYPDGSESVIRR